MIELLVEFNYVNAYKNLGQLNISVKDTGIGIDSDQQSTVFETFQQARGQKNTEYGGTGLGLAISKRLIELMGGTITLESKKGEGAKFTIVLPEVELLNKEMIGKVDSEDDIDLSQVEFE